MDANHDRMMREAGMRVNHPHFFMFFICHHILHFSTLLRSFFQLGVGRYRNASPHERIPFVQAVEEVGGVMAAEAYHSWIRHASRYFPCCLARMKMPCDVFRSCGQTETKGGVQPNFLFLYNIYRRLVFSFFYYLLCMKRT